MVVSNLVQAEELGIDNIKAWTNDGGEVVVSISVYTTQPAKPTFLTNSAKLAVVKATKEFEAYELLGKVHTKYTTNIMLELSPLLKDKGIDLERVKVEGFQLEISSDDQ